MVNQKAYLVLEDGLTIQANSIGGMGTIVGEVCFNTSMTGYQEIFSDPSYYGQILILNHVHIGNYGLISSEMQSPEFKISGLIVNQLENKYSRQAADQSLYDYLTQKNIIAIQNIDTRALVSHIRNAGAKMGIISNEILDPTILLDRLKNTPTIFTKPLAGFVSTTSQYELNTNGNKKVAVIDFGVKKSMLDNLLKLNLHLKIFPYNVCPEEIMSFKPDGIFLSNGPGDPAVMTRSIALIKQLNSYQLPCFGICLGHQLLALAHNFSTYKLHHGHRGANQPVKNLLTGLGEVTTQNHGFNVSFESVDKNIAIMSHINLNDDSLEGLKYLNSPFFSVQYHPENSPGPHDSTYLFSNFNQILNNN